MRFLVIMSLLTVLLGIQQKVIAQKNIYDFKINGLEGGVIDFAAFKGKKIMIVNTASKCGFTPQYEELETLYKNYQDKLVLIGFPSNNFLFQEPGDNQSIAAFCKKNYGVTFPMAEKINVKGKNKHPIYVWLTQKKYNHFSDNKVKWNFQKYLLNENGKLIAIFAPNVKPLSEEITSLIKK